MIRYLLFDLSDVICQMDHQTRLERLAAYCESTARELHDAVWASGLDTEFDLGRFTRDEVVKLFRTRFGFRGGLAELEQAWAAGFRPDRQLLAAIDEVRPSVRRAILSDNGPVLLEAMPRLLPEVWQRFDHVVFSCDINVLKPDAKAFQHALERIGCEPGEVLFFDDLADNVAAARSLGMEAEVYVDA